MTERVINILVVVTLTEMMFAIGLGVSWRDLLAVVRDWRLLTRAALANYVGVPLLTVVLLVAFRTDPFVAAGFLILAVCPGAPFGPSCTAVAQGNVPASVSLMVALAGSSALLAPVLLQAALQATSVLQSVESEPVLPGIDPVHVLRTLLLTQLVPLSLGLLVRQRWAAVAVRLHRPANALSAVLGISLLGLLLAVQFDTLRSIRLTGFAGMVLLLAGSVVCGWLLGGRAADTRRALALTTSLRNVGVGLVIATRAFPASPAVTAVIAYGIIEILGSFLLAVAWGRLAPLPSLAAVAAPPLDTRRCKHRQLS